MRYLNRTAVLGENTSDNRFNSSEVTSNKDGSVLERLETTQAMVGHLAEKIITYTGEVSYAAFTVTGCVAVKMIGYITTALTNHADSSSVGTATAAAGLIAATAGTAMQTVGQVWVDNAPSKFGSLLFGTNFLIGAGEDIDVVSTANIVGGVVEFYCIWTPLSSDGNVVAAV